MRIFLLTVTILFTLLGGIMGSADTASNRGSAALFSDFWHIAKAEAYETWPAHFVVIDRTGKVNSSIMRGWTQMVKMDYHAPYYKLQEDNTKAEAAVQEMFAKNLKPDKAAMAAAAKAAETTALVVLVVRAMDEDVVQSPFAFGPDAEIYTRTAAYADMYAYNGNGEKFIRRFLRERDLQPMGLGESPDLTIKWALGNLLNKMEGKPQI